MMVDPQQVVSTWVTVSRRLMGCPSDKYCRRKRDHGTCIALKYRIVPKQIDRDVAKVAAARWIISPKIRLRKTGVV